MRPHEAIRVLLVEDNDGDAKLVDTYLRRAEGERFSLERVDRLAAGLDRMHTGEFDIVLLDLTLPDSQGRETFEQALAAARKIPIIVMTGIDDTKLAIEAVRDGAQDYLVKRRVDTDLLVRAIRYAIERKQVQERVQESEQRYSLAVDGAKDGVWDWDLRNDKVYFSPRWKSMLGYSEEEVGESPDDWFGLVHPDDV